jgi:hypothetical protein
MFEGTLRENIDPLGLFSDSAVKVSWAVVLGANFEGVSVLFSPVSSAMRLLCFLGAFSLLVLSFALFFPC